MPKPPKPASTPDELRNEKIREFYTQGYARVGDLLDACFGGPLKGLNIIDGVNDQIVLLKPLPEDRIKEKPGILGDGNLQDERQIRIREEFQSPNNDLSRENNLHAIALHELIHNLQGDFTYRIQSIFPNVHFGGDPSAATLSDIPSNFRTNEVLSQHTDTTAYERLKTDLGHEIENGEIKYYIDYLREGIEIQSRLITGVAAKAGEWGQLPQNHEQLYVALADAGLKPPPGIQKEIELPARRSGFAKFLKQPAGISPTLEQTHQIFSSGSNRLAKDAEMDIGAINHVLDTLTPEGKELFWRETLPRLYSDFAENVGGLHGREAFGFGPNQLAPLMQMNAATAVEREHLRGTTARVREAEAYLSELLEAREKKFNKPLSHYLWVDAKEQLEAMAEGIRQQEDVLKKAKSQGTIFDAQEALFTAQQKLVSSGKIVLPPDTALQRPSPPVNNVEGYDNLPWSNPVPWQSPDIVPSPAILDAMDKQIEAYVDWPQKRAQLHAEIEKARVQWESENPQHVQAGSSSAEIARRSVGLQQSEKHVEESLREAEKLWHSVDKMPAPDVVMAMEPQTREYIRATAFLKVIPQRPTTPNYKKIAEGNPDYAEILQQETESWHEAKERAEAARNELLRAFAEHGVAFKPGMEPKEQFKVKPRPGPTPNQESRPVLPEIMTATDRFRPVDSLTAAVPNPAAQEPYVRAMVGGGAGLGEGLADGGLQIIHVPNASEEQREATLKLAASIEQHAARVGIKFDALKMVPGYEKENFAVLEHPNGKVVFFANMSEMMEVIQNERIVEGIVLHEAGHAAQDNASVGNKLGVADSIKAELVKIHTEVENAYRAATRERRSSLTDLKMVEGLMPSEELAQRKTEIENAFNESIASRTGKLNQRVHEQFGSREQFASFVNKFQAWEKSNQTTLEAQYPDLVHATPEAFAVAMENQSETYQQFKKEYGATPIPDDLVTFRQKLLKMAKDEAAPAQIHSDATHTIDPEFRQLMNNASSKNKSSDFATSFLQAREYVADRFALENAIDPRSTVETLEYLNSKNSQETDGRKHPAMPKRFRRISYIAEHGGTPSEEYIIRPTGVLETYPQQEQQPPQHQLRLTEDAPQAVRLSTLQAKQSQQLADALQTQQELEAEKPTTSQEPQQNRSEQEPFLVTPEFTGMSAREKAEFVVKLSRSTAEAADSGDMETARARQAYAERAYQAAGADGQAHLAVFHSDIDHHYNRESNYKDTFTFNQRMDFLKTDVETIDINARTERNANATGEENYAEAHKFLSTANRVAQRAGWYPDSPAFEQNSQALHERYQELSPGAKAVLGEQTPNIVHAVEAKSSYANLKMVMERDFEGTEQVRSGAGHVQWDTRKSPGNDAVDFADFYKKANLDDPRIVAKVAANYEALSPEAKERLHPKLHQKVTHVTGKAVSPDIVDFINQHSLDPHATQPASQATPALTQAPLTEAPTQTPAAPAPTGTPKQTPAAASTTAQSPALAQQPPLTPGTPHEAPLTAHTPANATAVHPVVPAASLATAPTGPGAQAAAAPRVHPAPAEPAVSPMLHPEARIAAAPAPAIPTPPTHGPNAATPPAPSARATPPANQATSAAPTPAAPDGAPTTPKTSTPPPPPPPETSTPPSTAAAANGSREAMPELPPQTEMATHSNISKGMGFQMLLDQGVDAAETAKEGKTTNFTVARNATQVVLGTAMIANQEVSNPVFGAIVAGTEGIIAGSEKGLDTYERTNDVGLAVKDGLKVGGKAAVGAGVNFAEGAAKLHVATTVVTAGTTFALGTASEATLATAGTFLGVAGETTAATVGAAAGAAVIPVTMVVGATVAAYKISDKFIAPAYVAHAYNGVDKAINTAGIGHDGQGHARTGTDKSGVMPIVSQQNNTQLFEVLREQGIHLHADKEGRVDLSSLTEDQFKKMRQAVNDAEEKAQNADSAQHKLGWGVVKTYLAGPIVGHFIESPASKERIIAEDKAHTARTQLAMLETRAEKLGAHVPSNKDFMPHETTPVEAIKNTAHTVVHSIKNAEHAVENAGHSMAATLSHGWNALFHRDQPSAAQTSAHSTPPAHAAAAFNPVKAIASAVTKAKEVVHSTVEKIQQSVSNAKDKVMSFLPSWMGGHREPQHANPPPPPVAPPKPAVQAPAKTAPQKQLAPAAPANHKQLHEIVAKNKEHCDKFKQSLAPQAQAVHHDVAHHVTPDVIAHAQPAHHATQKHS